MALNFGENMSRKIAMVFALMCFLSLCVADVKYGISQSQDVNLTNASNQVINGASQVTLVNCINITVTNVHGKILLIDTNYSRIFANSIAGIFGDPNNVNYEACIVLLRSSHNDIYGNTLSNSERGILIYTDDPYTGNYSESRYNNIYENKISGSHAGIYCLTGGSNTAIYANNITGCNAGIVLRYSYQNEVYENVVEDCPVAVSLSGGSDNNVFYNNDFLSTYVYENHESLPNLFNLYSVNNAWDAGYSKGGNYWSTYNGTDSNGDGIGDTAFPVYEKFVDRFPLMNPVNSPPTSIPESPEAMFPFSDIIAGIQNFSPADNGSYIGDVPLIISVRFSARSDAPNYSLIPYQEISCLYQLDNGEWKNASLYYASEQKAWYDPTFQGYWNQLDCNYSALLTGLSNGEHLLDIDLKPDLEYHYRISSDGTNVQENLLDNATITFYVFGNYNESVPTDQSSNSEPFPTTVVAITSAASLVIASVSLLIYFKRRRRNNEPKVS